MTPSSQKRVLVSAFACSPLRGSEEGIGWQWAIEIAKLGYKVTVITRAIHQDEFAGAAEDIRATGDLEFVFIDPAKWIRFDGVTRPLAYLYYYFWQFMALRTARHIHQKTPFDFTHHLTYGGIRMPTFMGALGVPMLLGPLGGGETAPYRLRRGYSLRGKIVDAVRDISNAFIHVDPFIHYAFGSASMIILRTHESFGCVPQKYHPKVHFEHDIGVNCEGISVTPVRQEGAMRVLYVGRALYWKGMHLGLRAFAGLCEHQRDATLTMVGSGPEIGQWRRLAKELGVADRVTWLAWVQHSSVGQIYADHDVLLFPTLHEAGGTVLYEAAAHGRPIVCLDLGAPGELVTSSFGFKVTAQEKSEVAVVKELTLALETLASDRYLLSQMGNAARRWAETQSWRSRVLGVYKQALVPK